MSFEVANTPEGFVVYAYDDGYWMPLRNFGERQGDARDFAFVDCPELSTLAIRALEKRYDSEAIDERTGKLRYKRRR